MESVVSIDWCTGRLSGAVVERDEKRLSELAAIFHDRKALAGMAIDQVVYRVEYFKPVVDATEGGLFFGTTILEPGKVGDEYFMTKGHFHHIRNRAEYYAVIEGTGSLILMDEKRGSMAQSMHPGSVHYIPGYTAHRVANTGAVPLVFMACWPSDAGYDYEAIEFKGFSARMLERNGEPQLIAWSGA